ncbi:hypothetical protein GH714_026207 [Hevea brasiliensis]|uniref:dynamin GTPase n=1 Tax=Hevea brasiliensis TaxID=3981 RepID=A0A6A6N6Y0_HEVBR|nr:hypothetical protein GH714_026207 [Hevea brasiliensis]
MQIEGSNEEAKIWKQRTDFRRDKCRRIVENELFKQDWRSRKKVEICQYIFLKWTFALLIGLGTGLVGFFNNLAVENIAGFKLLLTNGLMLKDKYYLAFASYAGCNMILAIVAAALCAYVAPAAAGSGIPEVKAYLNGVDAPSILAPTTLFVKIFGSIFGVASGFVVGMEGPMAHIGACIAFLLGQGGSRKYHLTWNWLRYFKNDRDRRDLVTCGAAAGVAAAFRAPVGGVLFALEEAASWWRSALLWRTFFTTAVVAVVLRGFLEFCQTGKCGLFGQGGLIMFDVSSMKATYNTADLLAVIFLGVLGGILGSFYNYCIDKVLRTYSIINGRGPSFKILLVIVISFLTSCCSYGLPWLAPCIPCPTHLSERCPTKGRSGNYKNFHCPSNYYNDLASLFFNTSDYAIRNMLTSSAEKRFKFATLLVFFVATYGLGIITYGIAIPSGLFIPVILAGASCGRLAGKMLEPLTSLDVGLFALLGAASFLGGTMRMTVSLCVILLELTNDLLMLPLMMLVILISKTVADIFNKGIYDQIVKLKGLPYLEAHAEPYLRNLVASDVVSGPLITFSGVERVGNILHALKITGHNGFPVIDEPPHTEAPELCGLVLRFRQGVKLEDLEFSEEEMEMYVDLHPITNTSPYTVVETTSLAKAAVLFRELGLRHLCVVPKTAGGAGKSAVLNSLIGHPILPTGENGATRAPISIDLNRDSSLSNKSIVLQIDNKSQQVSASALRHSLQDRLSKGSSGRSRDEIYLKLRTSTAPPLKLTDLPGLDQRIVDDSLLSECVEHNDAILLVIIPAVQAPEISSSRALRIAKEYDAESTRTIGVISKVDQAATESKALAAVQALLLNQGPPKTSDIPWVALIGQSVSIASAQSGGASSENSLETAWRAESESLKSILTGAPQSKLGRLALVEALAGQIRNRMKLRLPNLLSGLQGKSQIVQDELVRLGEQMVSSSEGTRALALELCREYEDKFLQHLTGGEGNGWKVVASFEGNFPNRIKQLPLDRHFDMNNVKRIVLEADGYQPYLISPEKGLRSLIKGVLELAKEPARLCVDEIVAIASAALDGFKNEAKKMVVALVDMEATSPQTGAQQSGGSLKSMKEKSDKDSQEGPALKTAGPGGEITAGFLLKKSGKTNGWSRRWFVLNEKSGKLGYTKKQEERHFRGVITLEECNIEEVSDEEETSSKSSKDKKANGPSSEKGANLVFKITSRVPYKTVLKAHSAVVLKAESVADKVEWLNKLRNVIQSKGGQVTGESGLTMRQSHSEGSLDTMTRRPADPEEELRWMCQEVRGYVEAVLNSLAANVPKAVVLCQVEKAREDMLNQLYSSISAQSSARIEELLQEDQNVKRKRERYQKQSSLLSKLVRQLSIHDNRAAAASSWSNDGGAESSPRTSGRAGGEDWRTAFDAAANGRADPLRSHSRRNSDPPQNGDASSGTNSSRCTPTRMPPAPPPSGSSYRY